MSTIAAELVTVVVPASTRGEADARTIVTPLIEQNLVSGNAVLVDLRLVSGTDGGFVTGVLSRVAEASPERVVLLGAGPAVEMFVSAAEIRFDAVRELAGRGALWVVEDREDLVTDLPEHSPLDETLFELFMQCELA